MEARRFGFGDILREAGAMFVANSGFLLAVTAIVAAGYIALDLTLQADASSVPSLIVGIFVQYLVVERLLADRLRGGGGRRYGSVFLVGLLGGLGMVVGFLLLIVPGLVLAAGWAAATAFVVVERQGGVEALGSSWRATAGSRLPIVLVLLATYAPVVVIFALAGFVIGGGFVSKASLLDGPVAIVATDVLVSVLGIWGWLLGAAIYNLAVPADTGVEDVFA